MIKALANRIAVHIKSVAPETPSVAVMTFSLTGILNTFFIVTLSVIISLLTGRLAEAIVVLVAIAFLRQISGGFHLENGVICVIVSATAVTVLSFSNLSEDVTLVLNILSLILVLLFAPSRIEHQTRIPKKHFGILKIASAALVGMNFLVESPVLGGAFFIQALTLIRMRGGDRHEKNEGKGI